MTGLLVGGGLWDQPQKHWEALRFVRSTQAQIDKRKREQEQKKQRMRQQMRRR